MAVAAAFDQLVVRASAYFGRLGEASTSWDWETFRDPEGFHWKYGVTPFSNVEIPLVTSIGYVVSLYALQLFMRNREPIMLKYFTAFHNMFLCVLSAIMVIGVTGGIYTKLVTQGWFHGWVCEVDPDYVRGPLYYWGYIFYLSKIVELVDSYLLALKKKPLILLHVYHHMTMVWVTWCGLHGQWGWSLMLQVFFNGLVHVAMYYYYFMSTIAEPPRWARSLTKVQISQFVSGIFFTIYFLMHFITKPKLHWVGAFPAIEFTPGCTGQTWAVFFMSSVNFSFLVLFLQFFFRRYAPRPAATSDTKKTN